MRFFNLIVFSFAAMLLVSCENIPAVGTTVDVAAAAAKPDHKPRYDYWQNGGGACCPYHAALRR